MMPTATAQLEHIADVLTLGVGLNMYPVSCNAEWYMRRCVYQAISLDPAPLPPTFVTAACTSTLVPVYAEFKRMFKGCGGTEHGIYKRQVIQASDLV
jgi:hypothetical protein